MLTVQSQDISISSSIKFKDFYKVLSNNLAELKCKKCISIGIDKSSGVNKFWPNSKYTY